MANRNKNYSEILAKKFDNLEYAQGYLLNIAESEDLPLADVLRETIQAMGLQNFAEKSGLSIQAVSDFVSQRQQWSTDKVIKHIEQIFELKVTFSLNTPDSNQVA